MLNRFFGERTKKSKITILLTENKQELTIGVHLGRRERFESHGFNDILCRSLSVFVVWPTVRFCNTGGTGARRNHGTIHRPASYAAGEHDRTAQNAW